MERNVLLAILISLAVLLAFQFLQSKFYPPKVVPKNATKVEEAEIKKGESLKFAQGKSTLEGGKQISILTPLFFANLHTSGGRFTQFKLLPYQQDRKNPEPVNLVGPNFFPLEFYLANSPEIAFLPLEYEGPEKMELRDSEKKQITLRGNFQGLETVKILTFKGDSYFVDVKVEIKNLKKEDLKDRLLVRGLFTPFVKGNGYVFRGPFYYTNHLVEVELKDSLTEYVGPLRYLGYMDVYFLVSVIPEKTEDFRATFRKLKEGNEFILWSPEFTLQPGGKITYNFKLYLGPKKSEFMAKEYPLLAKALYFGTFDVVAKPLLWLLKFFYGFTHNYGWAIVIITLVIRLLFFPLNQMSFKSMKRMQELQPVIQRLKEKYRDDPQTLQKEIMNLYRTHKINPFSGCLPILVQIPVFFAFYKVLLMSIELRHAPFILWINDLSAPERIYLGNFDIPWLGGIPLLTVLMGLTMFLQQKLTPTSLDPIQEKVMLLLPIFFIFLFVNFPSGLVLYWFVNNVLSIGQQLITLRMSKK